ncbi:MAG: hypothetical protein L0241_08535 [Planctomycetia bacterium]|nr:hypothetical protein [Planctomycetia bacterium]
MFAVGTTGEWTGGWNFDACVAVVVAFAYWIFVLASFLALLTMVLMTKRRKRE